jgi:beta-1,4-mannosyl-glycoprotein beta-1,4-N-acetylglucosaminyltransferase|tara:strand:+ start:126 stop:929 length:804 start_codon:yes stop_codon:yes gene_type:complete
MSKIVDCITFFDNNLMFNLRYKVLEKYVDYFIVCESSFDHNGKKKKKNFIWKKDYNKKKIKYFLLKKPFPKKNNRWENQAMQREYLLKCTDFLSPNDYILFSDPDEIINPKALKKFSLRKRYGIFLQNCFNYKFNLYNPHESPWEGTRVAKKKNLDSIDFLRQKVLTKNLKYNFFRFDKEKNIQIFKDGGWHFNNIMSEKDISLKLKTFAHSEFSHKKFSSPKVIKKKIFEQIDLFNRGHKYKVVKLDKNFPEYVQKNKKKFKNFII